MSSLMSCGTLSGSRPVNAFLARIFGFARHLAPQLLLGNVLTLFASVGPHAFLTRWDLTNELIAEAVAQVETVTCAPDDRCYAFPYQLADAHQRCTVMGRCKVGWIVTEHGGTSWEVWLDRHTGQGRARRQKALGNVDQVSG